MAGERLAASDVLKASKNKEIGKFEDLLHIFGAEWQCGEGLPAIRTRSLV